MTDTQETVGEALMWIPAPRGKVLFAENNVHEFVLSYNNSQTEQTNPLINLSVYHTPWLQVLQVVHSKYGNDSLAEVSKDSVESYIESYIDKHKLDIAKSDIPYLAKFMRLSEQKQGKAYQAKKKKT